MRPLYKPYNMACQLLARHYNPHGFDVTSNDSLCNTLGKVTKYYDKYKRLIIWNGGSANTIFQNRHTNICFRAWHDYVHVTYQLPFNYRGEIETCKIQQKQVDQFYTGSTAEIIKELLDIEIIKQTEYYRAHGTHVDDQYQFAIDCLNS